MPEDEPRKERLREQDEGTPSLQNNPPGWQEVPDDPGPQDLNYESIQWKRIPATDDGKVIFLPKDEAVLKEDAFIILGDDSLCDLVERR